LYSIPTEFGIPMKLIKMSLNKSYSIVCIGKNLCDAFPIQNGLKQEDTLLPFFSTLTLNMLAGR